MEQCGIKVLGTPLGTAEFVAAHARDRVATERELLHKVGRMPDLQCAWLILSKAAVPRAVHMLRCLPPSLSAEYAGEHDRAV